MGFSDASIKSMGCCLYIYNGEATQGRLIYANAKVVPRKSYTIPRLEFMAAQMLLKAYNSISKGIPEFNINPDKAFLFIDSTIVLNWIHTNQNIEIGYLTLSESIEGQLKIHPAHLLVSRVEDNVLTRLSERHSSFLKNNKDLPGCLHIHRKRKEKTIYQNFEEYYAKQRYDKSKSVKVHNMTETNYKDI
jgi:Pao retrotransposon peptidase